MYSSISNFIKAAQLRREEKRREDKERMMQEEDPDRQRRLEVKKH